MTNMQSFLGFYTEENISLVYYCLNEKHAEFVNIDFDMCMFDV